MSFGVGLSPLASDGLPMTEAYTDATASASIEVTEVPSTSVASKMMKLVKLKKNVVKAKEGFTKLRKPYRTPLPAARSPKSSLGAAGRRARSL